MGYFRCCGIVFDDELLPFITTAQTVVGHLGAMPWQQYSTPSKAE
jgi:hypothetical protein